MYLKVNKSCSFSSFLLMASTLLGCCCFLFVQNYFVSFLQRNIQHFFYEFHVLSFRWAFREPFNYLTNFYSANNTFSAEEIKCIEFTICTDYIERPGVGVSFAFHSKPNPSDLLQVDFKVQISSCICPDFLWMCWILSGNQWSTHLELTRVVWEMLNLVLCPMKLNPQ